MYSNAMTYDKVIIGAGLYGLYAANFCAQRGEHVLVIECESAPFKRATYINQARVHQGYHYPRSLSTAIKSAGYFQRFNEEYGFCINKKFEKIYATSKNFSWSNAEQFMNFCRDANIPCHAINPESIFKKGMCDGAFITQEYTYDAKLLCDYFVNQLNTSNVDIWYNSKITSIEKQTDRFVLSMEDGRQVVTAFLLNATYASSNYISKMVGVDTFKIKYELCEIILCTVQGELKNYGITVMDGPFFSIMPFGKTGLHSLTSVTFTPHSTSYEEIPTFSCQKKCIEGCNDKFLANCNECNAKPKTAYRYMSSLASKYLKDEFKFNYSESLFSMKPILTSSEIDDSRPTVIRTYGNKPVYVSVLSGKINTVYDLDEVLLHG
mgnify:CR=1 FL=1